MRLKSNTPSHDTLFRRGSAMTLALMRSRSALLVNTIHENTTVSPSRALAAALNEPKPSPSMSSATHSRYSSAPFSSQIEPARSAILR